MLALVTVDGVVLLFDNLFYFAAFVIATIGVRLFVLHIMLLPIIVGHVIISVARLSPIFQLRSCLCWGLFNFGVLASFVPVADFLLALEEVVYGVG